MNRHYLEISSPVPNTRAYLWGECRVLIGKEDTRWHLSISCADRYPTWDEIRDARYLFLPNHIMAAILLPPKEQYVNLHPNVFHVWEIKERGY